MFWINQKEYDEIANVIMKYCCDCSSYYCSEIEQCDVSDILEILNSHVSKKQAEEKKEKIPFDV